MAESFKTRLLRWGLNRFPTYRRTGGRITYIAADYREVALIRAAKMEIPG